jgi:SNF2 family DNA or RNA helicase
MGTGKTRIILEHIKRNKLKKVLIICPLVVINVWVEQLKKWIPEYTGGELFPSIRELGKGIVIQNYESVWRGSFGKWATKQEWDLIVCDECQNIKNAASKQGKFCFKLGRTAKQRIAMSGTPIPNGPLDAFGIYKFLDSGLFGQSYTRFEHKYAVVVDHEKYTTITGYRNMDDFQQCFDFLCLQIKSEVLDLPPISYSTINVELPLEARQFYNKFQEKFVAYLHGKAMSAPNLLVKLLRLQGLTSGVVKLDNGKVSTIHTAKADALKTILEGIDEPVVVFGRFRHDLLECERICRCLKRSYSELSGARKEVDQWTDVLGVQIQTGGAGIDLTKSNLAIFLSTGYSEMDYEQATARLYRPPQDRPVRIINIHCAKTIDEEIARALQNKKNVIDSLRISTKKRK